MPPMIALAPEDPGDALERLIRSIVREEVAAIVAAGLAAQDPPSTTSTIK